MDLCKIERHGITNIENDLAGITRLAGISLPECDRHMFSLGAAVYGLAWVSTFMAEVICYMDMEKWGRRDRAR